MVAYNFQARFAPAILDGTKCQTIRPRGKRRPPRVGETLQLFTGLRTKDVKRLLFRDAVCTSVEGISISARTGVVSMLCSNHWQWLDSDQVEALAKADGFASTDAFFDFFLEHYGQTFSGWLIKWTVPIQPMGNR